MNTQGNTEDILPGISVHTSKYETNETNDGNDGNDGNPMWRKPCYCLVLCFARNTC